MKRLCVFYRRADEWVGRPVEWIVCKECQHKIRLGQLSFTAATIQLWKD